MPLPPFFRFRLVTLLAALFAAALCTSAAALTINIRERGARGDGVTLDTPAINQAIADVHAAGGGTVIVPAGTYLSYSVRLRSHVHLRLEPGSVLLAADAPPPGEEGGYDAPEPCALDHYQDFGHSHFRNSLIWGEGLTDVSITGPGLIYGRGLSRGNGRKALPVGVLLSGTDKANPPDVLEADGIFDIEAPADLRTGPFGHPAARDWLPAGIGNKAIALLNCRNVLLRDFRMLHGGHFAILATGVDNLTIDNLLIDTNRDGMDIDSCVNVRITNCSVNSPWDDGICLKSSYALGAPRACENVTISDCFVSGFVEGTLLDGTRRRVSDAYRGGPMGRIKLGTESNGGFRNIAISNCVFEHCRGLALELVDGGALEDVVVSNITMREIFNAPLFVRLGIRQRAPEGTPPGTVTRVRIAGLNASGVAADHGLLVLGVPGHPIGEVHLSDISVRFAGGGTEEDARRPFPELERGYPEPHLFGRSPAWGLVARHVSKLRLRNVSLSAGAPDARPAVLLENVADAGAEAPETSAPRAP